MEWVSTRPSLPADTEVPGFGSIQKPLLSDETAEVYLLDEEAAQGVLILLSVAVNAERSERFLEEWWNDPSTCLLEVVQKTDVGATSRDDTVQVVMRARGAWVGGFDTPCSEDAILAFLGSLCELACAAKASGALPVVWAPLLWTARQGDTVGMSAVLADPATDARETKLVSDIGELAYWLATGMSPHRSSEGGRLRSARNWNPGIGRTLSDLIGRCTTPRRTDQIQSLDELVAALADLRSTGSGSQQTRQERESDAKAAGPPKEGAKGLAAVAGMHDLKRLLEKEVVEPLRNPEPYERYGLRVPNGVLLYGPPGCGKTYIARRLAEELGYYFAEIIPSEVASPYIHQSAVLIRDKFEVAAEKAPSVLFIDEFEALVPARSGLDGSAQYKAEEVGEFLSHLNESANKSIFVIAATNEPEKIDVAVRRTGRFDKLVYVGPPDMEARREMLTFHLAGRPQDEKLDIDEVAMALEGYSASDIKFLVDEAARLALDRNTLMSTGVLLEAQQRAPPSVPPEVELRYQGFGTRGV